MSRQTLINEIGEWLIDQALDTPDIIEMFEHVCCRLHAVGVPIGRARLTWPTLHPLFQAETALWQAGQPVKFEQFVHQDQASEQWERSPMAYMIDKQVLEVRRNLDGPNKLVDFPILEDLIKDGFTDYLLVATGFQGQTYNFERSTNGIIVTWACDRPGGFSDDDIAALKKIQRRFAAACKTVIQTRIASNITETYLGRQAGRQVLDGAIKLGDGQEIQAIVWYSDMRDSTALADTMPADALIALLNDYFDATAGPAIKYGGEVLDFIGDAVLAIFPYEAEADKPRAVRLATMALEESLVVARQVNEERKKKGLIAFNHGVALTLGKVMFGNIGVPSRLAFTVIGPVINEAARIEALTKYLGEKALVTAEIAAVEPEQWQSQGAHDLVGVSQSRELFSPRQARVTADAADEGKANKEPKEATLVLQ